MSNKTRAISGGLADQVMEDVAIQESSDWLKACDVVDDEGRLKDGYYMSGKRTGDNSVEFSLYKLPKPFSTLSVSMTVPEVEVSVEEIRAKKPKVEMKQV